MEISFRTAVHAVQWLLIVPCLFFINFKYHLLGPSSNVSPMVQTYWHIFERKGFWLKPYNNDDIDKASISLIFAPTTCSKPSVTKYVDPLLFSLLLILFVYFVRSTLQPEEGYWEYVVVLRKWVGLLILRMTSVIHYKICMVFKKNGQVTVW